MSDDAGNRGTELTWWLRNEILAILRDESPPIGERLTERGLAERLQVSRSPVRTALLSLHDDGYVSRTESGRYRVARTGADIVDPGRQTGPHDDEQYLRIASDRLDGRLPERITETALLRRYDLSKAQLAQLLLRISSEGWIAPLPGYGWTFTPVLTSLKAYNDSYRFRLLTEPASILEPTFRLDVEAVQRRRQEQQALVDEGLASVTGAGLFDLNTRFHETIAECSGNDFFLASLVRINRLRRLIEYRQALRPVQAQARCREHVTIADLLLAGDRVAASEALHDHLASVGPEKSSASPRD